MSVVIPIEFQNHRFYPRNRSFSECEAWLDLTLISYPAGIIPPGLDKRWGWTEQRVAEFLDQCKELGLINGVVNREWYGVKKNVKPKHRELALQVVASYNRIFGRKVSINADRLRQISAIVEEGRTQKPVIGLVQFEKVFEHQKKEWQDDSEMKKHLILETLCSKKFWKYLDAARLAVNDPSGQGFSLMNR